jgi:hypothetical protein
MHRTVWFYVLELSDGTQYRRPCLDTLTVINITELEGSFPGSEIGQAAVLIDQQFGRAVYVLLVHPASMNDDAILLKLVAGAIEEARLQGLDDIGQTGKAVATISTVRPDLAGSDLLTLVRRLRQD